MNTRERFLKRHEKNIEREKSAGVIKTYVNFEPPFVLTDSALAIARESVTAEICPKSLNSLYKDGDKDAEDQVVIHPEKSTEDLGLLTAYQWLNHEGNDKVKTFRVTTASASSATRHDKIRVSQRMSRL